MEIAISNIMEKINSTMINYLNLDKSTWEVVRFGDVVKEVRETSQNHIADGIDHVVGLEHLSPLDIHIRSWGNIADSTTFSRRFRKGQVLFGRRRAYQRKAVVADFDGICSGDIIVMEAIEDKLDPNLLPFLVHSEGFYNWAVSTSAGSLSPRTKFKSLAEYEFRLPPGDVQKKLAELLWAVDDLTEKLVIQRDYLNTIFSARVDDLIWNKDYPKAKLVTISVLSKGLQDGDWIESKDMSPSGVRLIQLADIGEGVFIDKSQRYVSEETFEKLNCFEILPGDLLLARMPDPIGRTCEIPDIGQKMITAVDCCIIRVNEKENDKSYCLYMLNSAIMRKNIISLSSGSTRQRISTTNLRNMLVPKPNKKDQQSIAKQLNIIHSNLDITNEHIAHTGLLITHILNSLL